MRLIVLLHKFIDAILILMLNKQFGRKRSEFV